MVAKDKIHIEATEYEKEVILDVELEVLNLLNFNSLKDVVLNGK